MEDLNIDPAWEYELYCRRQAQRYEELISGAKCSDCGHCFEPDDDFENPEEMGFCEEDQSFVKLNQSVKELGCERFED